MMLKSNSTHNVLFDCHNLSLEIVLEGGVVGVITGFLIVLYRFALEKAGEFLPEVYKVLSMTPHLIPVWIGALIIIGYILGMFVKREPLIKGSGIPQVEGALLGKLEMVWWKVIIGKFIGGVLAIGAGLSLGREGPSVQLGAALGQGFSRVFKRIKIKERYLLTSGASAGLAAAFNAPLAGVLFALEELHKNFSPYVLLSAAAAAIAADYVSRGFFGVRPVLPLPYLSNLPLDYYFHIVILGVIIGVLGVVFNRMLLTSQNLYSQVKGVPRNLWIIIPLLLTVPLGFLLPQVLSGGHGIISSLVGGDTFTLGHLFVLLMVKFFFTMLSYGSGAPGGIFFPLLAIGALIGGIYAHILVEFFQHEASITTSFIVLAMAGYFSAVVRAPLTGIILITEMTGSLDYFLSVALVSIIAYIVANLLGSKPIYDSLLEGFISGEINDPTCEGKDNKVILEFPIGVDSQLVGKEVQEISWPENCLLVAIRRGEEEIIPRGNTVIYAGDWLMVFTNEDMAATLYDKLNPLLDKRDAFHLVNSPEVN